MPAAQSPPRSAMVSLAFGLWTVMAVALGFAVTDNAVATPQVFLFWLGTHWWAMFVALIINPGPVYRAWQAIQNAQKGVA